MDADYYGYRDEEDGSILEFEKEQEALGMSTAKEGTPDVRNTLFE